MSGLPFAELEQAYEHLAEAIDRAGAARESLFLAKLALVLADKLGDLAAFDAAIAIALQDLPPEVPESPSLGPPGA